MNLDGIFSYGSPVNIIIRAITPTRVGTQTYQVGQPITMWRNANINFSQTTRNTVITQGSSNLLGNQQTSPNNLNISNISLSTKLLSLFFKHSPEVAQLSNCISLVAASIESDYYFNEDNVSNIYVYENGNLITNYNFDEENNYIHFNIEDEDEHEYMMFYNYQKLDSLHFTLDYPQNPYFQVEIYGVGNNSGQNSKVALILKRCELSTNYNMNTGDTNKQDISFKILSDKDNQLIIY